MSVLSRRAMVGAAMGASLGAGCGQQPDPAEAQGPWTLRYRLRVRVEADGKVHEGSGVFQSEYRRLPLWTPMRTQEFAARGWGEAIEIDLGERGSVFALMDTVAGVGAAHRFSPLEVELVIGTLSEFEYTSETFNSGEVFELAAALHGERALSQRFWPTFVAINPSDDLSSASLVELPGQNYQPWRATRTTTLDSVFGTGAQLADVTLEVVGDPVSSGVESRHRWVRTLQGSDSGSVTGSAATPLSQNLAYYNFVMNGFSR